MPASVFIADDHPIVLSGLVSLISSVPDFLIVGTASDGEAALRGIEETRPALVVVDLNMPGRNGIEVIQAIAGGVRSILLAATMSPAEIYDAVAAGAAGLILKEAAPAELLSCLRAVSSGGTWLPTEDAALAAEHRRRQSWSAAYETLTEREREIVALLVGRHSNKEIAHRLGISEGTAKIHLNNIYRKFNGASRDSLIEMAPRGTIWVAANSDS